MSEKINPSSLNHLDLLQRQKQNNRERALTSHSRNEALVQHQRSPPLSPSSPRNPTRRDKAELHQASLSRASRASSPRQSNSTPRTPTLPLRSSPPPASPALQKRRQVRLFDGVLDLIVSRQLRRRHEHRSCATVGAEPVHNDNTPSCFTIRDTAFPTLV